MRKTLIILFNMIVLFAFSISPIKALEEQNHFKPQELERTQVISINRQIVHSQDDVTVYFMVTGYVYLDNSGKPYNYNLSSYITSVTGGTANLSYSYGINPYSNEVYVLYSGTVYPTYHGASPVIGIATVY